MKVNPNMQAQIEAATVRFTRRGGLGVIVPGQMVVTAAHVVDWSSAGGMTLGDFYLETIEAHGHTFTVQPLAVEPVADIAVLGTLDNQAFPKESESFEGFCESIAPARVLATKRPPAPFVSFPVHVFTHAGKWIRAEAQLGYDGACLWFEAAENIEGGTSGGPVVTDDGLLAAIVSTAAGSGQTKEGKAPFLPLAVPLWLLRTMLDPEGRNRRMRRLIHTPVHSVQKTKPQTGGD